MMKGASNITKVKMSPPNDVPGRSAVICTWSLFSSGTRVVSGSSTGTTVVYVPPLLSEPVAVPFWLIVKVLIFLADTSLRNCE